MRGTTMRFLAVLGLVLALAVPTTVWGEAEWFDGSPPPLDFGLQVTAAPSTTAPYPWLRSTDSPQIEQTWNATGVNTNELSGVTGGVADGMTSAISSSAARR